MTTQFQKGDKVFIKDYPTLKGRVLGIIPADDDQPEYLEVLYYIPEGEPDFPITGIYENMWSLPDEVEYTDPMQAEYQKALYYVSLMPDEAGSIQWFHEETERLKAGAE